MQLQPSRLVGKIRVAVRAVFHVCEYRLIGYAYAFATLGTPPAVPRRMTLSAESVKELEDV